MFNYGKCEKKQFLVYNLCLAAFTTKYVLPYKACAITDRLSFLRVACFISAEIQESSDYLKL